MTDGRFFPGTPMRYVMGVDLGTLRDYTAIVVVEKSVDSLDAVFHAVRFAYRLPQQLPYPTIVNTIGEAFVRLPPMPQAPLLVVDSTGLGRPVTDMFFAAGLDCVPVTLTAAADWSYDDMGGVRLPKSVMVSTLNVALQEQRVGIAAGIPIVATLRQELGGYRARLRSSGRETFENAASAAAHDDLVIALAIAVFGAENLGQRYGMTRLI
jgi:hypothetical protein